MVARRPAPLGLLIAILLVALAALGPAASGARAPVAKLAASPSLNLQNQWGGATYPVAVAGNRAYAGFGQRLYVLDASTPGAAPVLGMTEVLGGLVLNATVNGSLVYVALGPAGMTTVDVANPAAPRAVGHVTGNVAEVVVDGARMYLVGGTAGVKIVETANPATTLGSFGEFVNHVAAGGDYAFTVARNLVLWDVTNPAAPRSLRELANWADGVALAGTILFATTSEESAPGERRGFVQTWDLTNPRRPVALGKVPTAGQARFTSLVGSELWVLSGQQLERFDARDPGGIPRLGSAPALTEAQQAARVADHAWLGAGAKGLRAIPLDGTGSAEGQRLIELPGRPESVAQDAGRLYVEDAEERVLIYDAANPAAGALGQVPTTAESGAMVAAGGYLYVGTSDRRLRIFDVRDPAAVRLTGELSFAQIIARLAVGGGYAYLATDPHLRVVDVRNPAAPQLIAQTQPSGGVTDLALGGRWLYATGPNTGPRPQPSLKVIDVRDPSVPRERGSTDALASTAGLATADELVFVSSLQVVDACRPDAPLQLARLSAVGRTRSVAADGWRVFTARRGLLSGGMLGFYDVHVPAAPVEVSTLNFADTVDGVSASDGHFWASAREAGLVWGTAPDVYYPTPTPDLRPTSTRPPGLLPAAYLPFSERTTGSVRRCPAR